MATRDVILKAFQDLCRSKATPLHLAAIGPADLGVLAEVAAGAVEATDSPFTAKTFYSLACEGEGCKAEVTEHEYGGLLWMEDKEDLLDSADVDDWSRQPDGRILCLDCRQKPGGDLYEEAQEEADESAPTPVTTQAEDRACARRSGLGEVG